MQNSVVLQYGGMPKQKSAAELYNNIDKIQHGSASWKTYSFCYSGPLPPLPPQWMTCTYELCMYDTCQVLQQQFANLDFKDKINYTLYKWFNKAGKHTWSNFMSGDQAWKQAVSHNQLVTFQDCYLSSIQDTIAKDLRTYGSIFIPVIGRSDKTTVYIATGHQEYHPVYQSPGNFVNTAQ